MTTLIFGQVDSTVESDTCGITHLPNIITIDCAFGQDWVFQIYHSCPCEEYHLQIYNRWGELQFEARDETFFWNAEDAPQGTYTWKMELKYFGKPMKEIMGHVHKLD